MWKLTRIKMGFRRGSCPLCLRKEDVKHTLIKCSETKKLRKEFARSKWLSINEDRELYKFNKFGGKKKITGDYLPKSRCKWEKMLEGYGLQSRLPGNGNIKPQNELREEERQYQ
jgi:hypothetical protein